MNQTNYFDDVSLSWDNMRRSFFPDSVREKAILESAVGKGCRILDMGAGTGFITEGLIDMPVSVVAIDRSQEMINIMKDKFCGKSNISYIKADSDMIPLPDSSIDIAFANMFLHHVEDPAFVIRELYRVLDQGGKLIITDLDAHANEFLVKEQYDRWMGFRREDIERWFEEAGLGNVKVIPIDEKCSSKSTHSCDQADISIFLASGLKKDLEQAIEMLVKE